MKITSLFLIALLSVKASAFELVGPNQTATVLVPASEPEYVRLAAADLVSDVQKITGKTLRLVDGNGTVVLASLNRPESAALLEKLAPGFGDGIKGKWEAYRIETVGGRLIIAGSDERGTMFGLYAFIEKYLGVDPLYYWSSRPPQKRATLAWDNVKLSAGEPTFRFRGWFINDEDLLTEFRLDGGDRRIDYKYYHNVISPSVSARIYEAALRFQMNVIIPSSFVDIRNPAEARLIEDAARRGLFVTMHHVEPVGVSAFAFDNFWKDRGATVPFAFTQQRDKFREIWREYAGRWAKFGSQVIWQLGLRGIADRPVWTADPGVPKSDEGRGKLISDAMATQWEIIRSVDPRPQPLATTTLWMEGAALHAAGHLKFPQGVAVIFSDNSPGWELQNDFYTVKREAGRPYGIYYHHQLWGSGPHLVQGVSVWRTHKIFKEVVGRGSTNYAMLNVSNIRPFVLGIEASARMLRDFSAFDPRKFLTAWCEQHFGAQAKPAEDAYRKLFASFLADKGKRAMLDGEWMHAASKAAKGDKTLLKKAKTQREKVEQAGANADQIAAKLEGADREFFESNFMSQQKIMLGLLRWHECAASQNVTGMRDALALITLGKALASRDEFRDWFRGDRKMNLAQLNELTAKITPDAGTKPEPAATVPQTFEPELRCIGRIKPRAATEIAGSNWSVGAETMDRDFTIYANWKKYLGPLGAKAARVQSGWAKTEKEKGRYDWAWLDEIIPDMAAQGVRPWVCLCYGNPIYEGGGGTGLGGGLPKGVALDAWDRYVAAVVERYGKHVNTWEIWNEPAGPIVNYAELVVRTAKIIRRIQPKARIIAAAWGDTKAILEHLKQNDALGLVNEFTYHPYRYNPDETYRSAAPKLKALLASYASHLTLRQGENGAPSEPGSFGAIAKYEWTEEKQAKWALRRLLGDLGNDIPSSYFSICDMQYPDRRNFKGLLAINDDKTVHHAKLAYFAVQRIMAIFDNTVRRLPDFAGKITGAAPTNTFALFAYRTDAAANIVTLWRDSHRPGEHPEAERVTVTLPGLKFTEPVYVDMLTGKVYALPVSFTQVPIYDSPVLIAEKAALPLDTKGHE